MVVDPAEDFDALVDDPLVFFDTPLRLDEEPVDAVEEGDGDTTGIGDVVSVGVVDGNVGFGVCVVVGVGAGVVVCVGVGSGVCVGVGATATIGTVASVLVNTQVTGLPPYPGMVVTVFTSFMATELPTGPVALMIQFG